MMYQQYCRFPRKRSQLPQNKRYTPITSSKMYILQKTIIQERFIKQLQENFQLEYQLWDFQFQDFFSLVLFLNNENGYINKMKFLHFQSHNYCATFFFFANSSPCYYTYVPKIYLENSRFSNNFSDHSKSFQKNKIFFFFTFPATKGKFTENKMCCRTLESLLYG